MGMDINGYYNLAERVEDAFSEIDSDTCSDLRESDGEYIVLWDEALKIQKDFPAVARFVEVGEVEELSADELGALFRYLGLKHEMEGMERKAIYFRGHADSFAYLKKIGAI